MSKIITGIDEISEYTGLDVFTLMNLQQHYDLPLKRGADAIWTAQIKDLKVWLADMGIESWEKLTMAKIKEAVNKKMRSGPGRIIKGDLIQISNKLDRSASTLMDFMAITSCPVRKIPDTNQFEVDLNRWQDFLEDYDKIPRSRGF